MNGPVEWTAERLEELQSMTIAQWTFRGLITGIGVAAIWWCQGHTSTSWYGILPFVAAVLLAGSVVAPESTAPLLFAGFAGIWWIASVESSLPTTVFLAVLLAAFHLGCMNAALGPLHAATTARARQRLVIAAVVYLGVSLITAAGVGLLSHITVGPVVAWLAVIVVLLALVSVLLSTERENA